MDTKVGIIKKIYEPYLTDKKNIFIQRVKIQTDPKVIFIPEIHENIELLNGLKIGDKVNVKYKLYGKEKKNEKGLITFHTPVIKNIKKI